MLSKSIRDLTEEDLRQLIDSQVQESKTLEYKRQLPDRLDAGKVKFLRTLAAFANTDGGDVLFGMEAEDGLPKRLVGLQMASPDETLLWMESVAAAAVEPRITGIQYQFVQLATGGSALVIRVPRSWALPHRVSVGSHAHFYGRNSAGTYQLDVAELRRAFTLSESISERIRSFRVSRLLALGANESPVPLVSGAKVVVHLVPFSSFSRSERVMIAPESESLMGIYPPGSRGWDTRLNLDGRLSCSGYQSGLCRSFAQLYRNGIIEALFVVEKHQEGALDFPSWYEEWVVTSLRSYMKSMYSLGIATPIFVFLSVIDVSGYVLRMDHRMFSGNPADRNVFLIPEVEVNDIKSDPADFMKPIFDNVWNAFGHQRSMNYDSSGVWLGPQ